MIFIGVRLALFCQNSAGPGPFFAVSPVEVLLTACFSLRALEPPGEVQGAGAPGIQCTVGGVFKNTPDTPQYGKTAVAARRLPLAVHTRTACRSTLCTQSQAA